MKQFLLLAAIILAGLASSGQTIKRNDNETAGAFAKRIKPDSTELVHQAIETNTWDSSNKAIIAFYGYHGPDDPNDGFTKIFGHLYLPVGSNTYRDIRFGPFEEDGGYPEIISVFFANADKDKAKELLVLCKYPQQHYDYGGAFYETFIFDHPQEKDRLVYFQKLSESFTGCECSWRNGKTKKAKYKTAKDIRAKLVAMGF